MEFNRTRNTLRNTAFGLANKCIMMIIPFIIRTIIIKYIGAEYIGLNSLFTSILSVLSLSELGFGSTLVYMMYKPVAEGDIEKIRAIMKLYRNIYKAIGVFILILGLCLLPFLNFLIRGSYPNEINIYILYLIYLANTVISYFLFAYKAALFTAYQRIDINSKITMILYLITSIIQILALVIFRNYYVYAIFNPIYTIAQNLCLAFAAKRLYPDIYCSGELAKGKVKEIYKKTFALTGHKIGGTIIGSLDSVVISAMLGLGILTRYSNYFMILSTLMAFIGIGMNSVLPSIGNYLINRDKNEQYMLFSNLTFILVWVVGWFTVCLLCLYQPFITLWLGKDMLLDFNTVILFCIYFYSWQFRVLGVNFKDAAGMWNEDMMKPYVASIVDIVLNIVLVLIMGLNGVLIATIICMVFIFYIWETWVLFNKLFCRSAKEYVLKHIFYFLAWLVVSIITYMLSALLPQNGILWFAVKVMICIVIPNLLYLIVFYQAKEYKFIYGIMKNYLSSALEKTATT